MSASSSPPLLDAALLRGLERWSLVVKRTSTGVHSGERRSRRQGRSLEFADFREYVPGDDIRFVDWKSYARLDRLFLKLFLHEQELNVLVLLDLSESMTFGDPPKSLLARRLAAALGFLALARQDGVTVAAGGGGRHAPTATFPLARGRGWTPRLLDFLQHAPEGGSLPLSRFVDSALGRFRGRGLVVLVSDLLDRAGHEAAILPILARRHEAIVLHVLSREEWDPALEGDLRLQDSEGGPDVEASATPAALEAYRRRVTEWSEGIDDWCRARGVTYLRVLDDAPPEDVILKTLVRMGRVG